MIGIDLGTTHSLVALWRDGRAQLVPNGLGEHLTPSCVSLCTALLLYLQHRAHWLMNSSGKPILDSAKRPTSSPIGPTGERLTTPSPAARWKGAFSIVTTKAIGRAANTISR